MPLLADTHDSPFALLMARSFLAVPIGSPPSRLDLMSAFFGALTVALCVLLVRHLGAPRAAAAASALALGFGSTFWAEAVVASPHTPRNALLLGAFLALLHWADARRAALLWVATGLYVLSVADHLPLLSVLPALAFYVFAVKRRATGQQLFMVLSLCLAVACSGVARQGFAGPAGVATRLPLMSEVWMAELGLLATALAAVGISRFVKQQTRESALFVLATLGTASWALGSPPSGPTELLPALLLAWPIVGIGIGRVADACIGRTARLGALGLLLLLLPSLNFVPNHPASRKAKNHQMVQSRYTAALSQALPEQAVIVTADETREPAMRYWRFGTAGAPPVVAIPWNPDRIRQLHARGHEVYAFKPSRAHFELMGLRFTPIARIEIRMSLLEYLETIPRGSLVAAAAGSALVPKLGPQAARAFRPIGGAAGFARRASGLLRDRRRPRPRRSLGTRGYARRGSPRGRGRPGRHDKGALAGHAARQRGCGGRAHRGGWANCRP